MLYDEIKNKYTIRNAMILFIIFIIIVLLIGVLEYNLASATLRKQISDGYNGIMNIFILQTATNFIGLFLIFAFFMRQLFAMEEKHKSNITNAEKIIAYREKMLRALNEMALILLAHSEPAFDNILNASLKPVAETVNLDEINIFKCIYTDTDKYIEQIHRWEKKEEGFIPIDKRMRMLPDTTITRKWISFLEKGIDINIHTEIMSEEEKEFLSAFGIKSVLMTPVHIKNKLWGIIIFQDHKNEILFDEISIDMMHSAAHLLIDAIVREQIYFDTLTGIFNKRYFNEKMNIWFKNLTRSNGMLSVVMIDIDFFKYYNDTYGHIEGDKCLKTIAQIISKSIVRESDFVARYGGEEFVVVLPNTDDDGAHKVAKRLIENIHNCNIPHEKSTVAACVTISIGIAVGKVDYKQSSENYIKRADEMLYISKKDGRDRYTMGMI